MKKYSFDKKTLKKIFKGMMIAGGGAAIVYILQYIQLLDLGEFTPLAVAICSILINVVKSYIEGE